MAKERSSKGATELRKRAEKILAEDPHAIRTIAPADIQKLIHELNVHQIELEMQNEELRHVQLELQEARDRYLNLYDFAPTGYFILDHNSLIVDVNLAGSELLGSEKHRLIGAQFTASISPDYQDVFYFHRREVLKTGIKGNCELEMLKADGTPFQAQLISMAIPEKDGNINQCRTAVIDISERKQAEKALRESEERYRTLFESAAEAIIIADIETKKLQYVNPAACTMLGYSQEELTRMSISDIHPKTSLEHVLAEFDAQARGEKTLTNLPCLKKDGTIIYADINATKVIIDGRACNVGFFTDITERKQVEEQNTIILSTTTEGFVLVNAEDRHFLDINDAYCHLMGYSRDELLSMRIEDVAVEETPGEVARYMQQIIESGNNLFEARQRCKDGRIVDIEISISYMDIEGGRFFAFIRDTSERKRAEESLKRSERNYKELAESISDVFLAMDKELRCTYWNKASEELTGISAKDILGKYVYDIFPDVEVTRKLKLEDIYLKAMRTKQSQQFVNEYHFGGKDFVLEITAYPSQDGASVFIKDITERKRVEESLASSEKKYRQLVEKMREGVWIIDKDARTSFVNPRMAEMLGYTVDEMQGKPLFSFMDERGAEIAKRLLERRSQDIVEQHDFEFVRKDGSRIYVILETSPISDEAGNYLGALGCATDITERKNMQEQLVMQDRLASIGQLASGIAHEINNPLTSILGFSQVILRGQLPDDVRADLKIVCSEAERTANIVKGLLTFARQHPLLKEQVNMNKAIDSVLDLRAYEMRANNIEVIKHFGELPEIIADNFQMQQVFLNIIVNAEYFMIEAHKRGTLTITTERLGNVVRIAIADDGPGIAEEQKKRLFNPFTTTKPVGKGTGLGLSICHGIVIEHGGRIYAESESGKGATFVVELPISQ